TPSACHNASECIDVLPPLKRVGFRAVHHPEFKVDLLSLQPRRLRALQSSGPRHSARRVEPQEQPDMEVLAVRLTFYVADCLPQRPPLSCRRTVHQVTTMRRWTPSTPHGKDCSSVLVPSTTPFVAHATGTKNGCNLPLATCNYIYTTRR